MNFVDRLLSLMKERNITAYKLSKELSISESLFSKWQKDPGIEPSSMMLKKLSDYFQVSMEWLLTGEGAMYKEQGNILSRDEMHLVENYRDMNEKQKREIINRSAVILASDGKKSSASSNTNGEEAATIERSNVG